MTEIVKEERPEVLGGLVVKAKTGCGNLYCQLTWCGGRLFEVFANLGKSGGCAACQSQAITRLATSGLRFHVPADEFIDQLEGLQCPSPVMWPKTHRTLSCPDAIAGIMKKYGKLSIEQVIQIIRKTNGPPGEGVELTDEQVAERTEQLREEREAIEDDSAD